MNGKTYEEAFQAQRSFKAQLKESRRQRAIVLRAEGLPVGLIAERLGVSNEAVTRMLGLRKDKKPSRAT